MKNFHLNLSSARALIAGTCAAATLFAPLARAEDDVMILLDRSGSMSSPSVADGALNRWEVAKQLILDDVDLITSDSRRFALRVFNGSSLGVDVRPLGSDRTSVRNAITGPDPLLGLPSGSTPLAGAICKAVDDLLAHLENEDRPKYLLLYSDGMENSTPIGNECQGPDSTTGDPYDLGSWQRKVMNKVTTSDAGSEAEPPPIIVNATFLFEHEPLIFSAFAGPAVPPEVIRQQVVIDRKAIPKIAVQSPIIRSLLLEPAPIPRSIVSTPSLALVQAFTFFGGLTRETFGTFRKISSDSVLPQLGDVTHDQCVDQADLDAVKAHYGEAAAQGNPLDINDDGMINVYDYRNVLTNFGEGSGC